MKSERRKVRLTLLMVVLSALSLAACAMEMEGDEELSSEEIELLAEEEGAEAAVAPDTTSEAGPIEMDASCTPSIDSTGHGAIGRCSGHTSSGTFRVTAVCCLTSCSGRIGGNWAFLQGGTSTLGCGSAFASSPQIQMGPAGG